MAQAVAAGAAEVPGAEVELLQVAETLPLEVLEKMGAVEAKKAFAHVPLADPKRISEADALLFGTGTRLRQRRHRPDAGLLRRHRLALGQWCP